MGTPFRYKVHVTKSRGRGFSAEWFLITTDVSYLQRFSDCSPKHHCVTKEVLQAWQRLLQTGGPEYEMGWGEEAVPGRRCRSGQYPEPHRPGIHHLADVQAQQACVDWPQQQRGKGSIQTGFQIETRTTKLCINFSNNDFFHRLAGDSSGSITGYCHIPDGVKKSLKTTMAVCIWMWTKHGRLHRVPTVTTPFARGHQVR